MKYSWPLSRRRTAFIVAPLLFLQCGTMGIKVSPRDKKQANVISPSLPPPPRVNDVHHDAPIPPLVEIPPRRKPPARSNTVISRREWFEKITLGAVAVPLSVAAQQLYANSALANGNALDASTPEKKIAPVNLTKVAAENTINVTLMCGPTTPSENGGCITVDRKTFSKVKNIDVPSWLPTWLRPKPRVIKQIPNSEVLEAAIIAGSATETVRTALLYPLSTIKSRIQAVEGKRRSWRRRLGTKRKNRLRIKRRIQVLVFTFQRQLREGNLYAGILPSIIVSVPCAGVYYGVRDVTKRMLTMTMDTPTKFDDLAVSLIGAIVADVVSLIVRTPADLLAIRLQVGTLDSDMGEVEKTEIVGDWFSDAVKRLPAVILTDLPYLLTRITLNGLIAQGNEGIGRYEFIYIVTACTCAVLTTPFDVARTRILVDSNDDPTDGIDGGSGQGLIMTMQTVMQESDGGFRNLFRGWFERLIYLGIAVAWLQPFIILAYLYLRDALLLEWFD